MRAALPNALSAGGGSASRRLVALSGLMVVLVAVAAGVVGATHFSGPRWVPHLSGGRRTSPLTLSPRSSPQARKVAPPAAGSPMPLGPVVWVPVGVALMVAAVLAWRWWTGHRRRPGLHVHAPAVAGARPDPAEAAPEPEFLLTGIEPTLQLLDEPREPADAIVRAWLGLEQSAQESGIVRRPEETPTEFTARILKAAFADDRAVQVLLRLYLRARFGDRPVTSDDVTAVRGILRELVQTWRSSASTATAGPR